MKKSTLKKQLELLGSKYFDLVWSARQDKTDLNHPGRVRIEAIRKKYASDVASLCGPSGDWHHGFNNGCLATVRLIRGLLGTAEIARHAEADFPFLDT